APPADLRSIARASYVPAPLSTVIMANLGKRPAERAANARIFGRDLIAAARQSGLYPEEIAAQSTLFSPSNLGAVKLASKERTKARRLPRGLAARLNGVAAAAAAKADTALRSEEPAPAAAPPPPALPSPQEAQPSETASLASSPDDPVRDTVPGAPPQAEE